MFALSAVAVAAAGVRLARDGHTIAEGTGLGGMWVGAILVAAATSLPELFTDINAVWQGHPSLAVGDLFGSSMANMMLLGMADLLTRHTRVLTRVAINQALVGTLALCLTLIAGLGIVVGGSVAILALGWATIAIGAGYVLGMRLIHTNRDEPPFRAEREVAAQRPRPAVLGPAFAGFGVAALVIVVAAPYLASSAATLSSGLGIGDGFGGMVLLALTTSLPEASVSVASVRSGAYALAVGNLLGSNCFNMAALVPLDLVHGARPILGDVEPALLTGALSACILMGLAMLDVLNRSERRLWLLEPGPALIVLVYVAGLYATYHVAAG